MSLTHALQVWQEQILFDKAATRQLNSERCMRLFGEHPYVGVAHRQVITVKFQRKTFALCADEIVQLSVLSS